MRLKVQIIRYSRALPVSISSYKSDTITLFLVLLVELIVICLIEEPYKSLAHFINHYGLLPVSTIKRNPSVSISHTSLAKLATIRCSFANDEVSS